MHSFYLDSIRQFEGFTARATSDYAQISNGYGTKALYPGEVIDRAEAERRFQAEIGQARNIVDKAAPHVDEGTKAALTSLTYNAGTAWIKSGLGDAVRRGALEEVREIFQKYNKAGGEVLPGLVRRRATEAEWIGQPQLVAQASLDKSPTAQKVLAEEEAQVPLAVRPEPTKGFVADPDSEKLPPIILEQHKRMALTDAAALLRLLDVGSAKLDGAATSAALQVGLPKEAVSPVATESGADAYYAQAALREIVARFVLDRTVTESARFALLDHGVDLLGTDDKNADRS